MSKKILNFAKFVGQEVLKKFVYFLVSNTYKEKQLRIGRKSANNWQNCGRRNSVVEANGVFL